MQEDPDSGKTQGDPGPKSAKLKIIPFGEHDISLSNRALSESLLTTVFCDVFLTIM